MINKLKSVSVKFQKEIYEKKVKINPRAFYSAAEQILPGWQEK